MLIFHKHDINYISSIDEGYCKSPKINIESNEFEWRTYAELRGMFNESDIVDTLKTQRLSRAGHVWSAKNKLVHTVIMWKPEETRPTDDQTKDEVTSQRRSEVPRS